MIFIPFLYLFLKIINKLKLNIFFYPIFYFFNKFSLFHSCLPTIPESNKIVINNSRTHVKPKCTYKFVNHKIIYDLQIIIPVYNSEKYISECLNSILRQNTDYNFSIILINDGSTDNTVNILNKYKYNPLIKIVNQPNLGRSDARNTGLHYVNSKYTMFVDSDDKLAPRAIQNLLDCAIKNHSDMLFGGYYVFKNNGHLIKKMIYKNHSNLMLKSSDDVNGFLWGKVFKSSLFNFVRFPSGYEFEDTILAFLIYPKCHIISSIDYVVYLYRDNPSSISNNFYKNNVSVDSFLITDLILKLLPRYTINIDQYIYNTFLAQVKMNCLRNIYDKMSVQKSIFVLTCDIYNRCFSSFHTNIRYYKPLEESLLRKNYNNYILFCIMK